MRGWPVLLLPLVVAGCLSRELPPANHYLLSLQGETPKAARAASSEVLKLAPLRSVRPFATTGLIYRRGGVDQNQYAFNRWADSPTRMLALLLTEALNRSGLYRAVLPPGTGLRADLRLEGMLFDFSLHLEADDPHAVAEARFLLVDGRTKQVLAGRRFRVSEPLERETPESGALALNRAANRLAAELIHWLDGLPRKGG